MQRVKLQGAGGKILKNEGTSRQLCELYTVLGDAEIPDAERTFRKQRLQQAADLANQDPFANRFFQLAHEIRSLAFLPQYGNTRMAYDSKQEGGADFVLNGAVYVECVCASPGRNVQESGLDPLLVRNTVNSAGLIDYAEKNRLLKARLTNSLQNKVHFYQKHLDRSIPSGQPYVIFLSPGYLTYEWFEEEYGAALTEILLGRGQPTITINVETGKVVASGYAHENSLPKYNGAAINCKGYHALTHLPTITQATKSGDNTFLFMTNDTTHSPVLLQAPDYSVSGTVDNTEYDSEHADRFTVDGKSIVMEEDVQFAHYDSNMASLMQLGKWFDYMRKNGVYDNTRIILVADHGRGLYLNWDRVIDNGPDTDFFFPLLMVKGFSFSDTFMTTADVPTLATSGLIDNPTNPFTGNAINADAKYDRPFYAFMSYDWDTSKNNGNQYFPGDWYRIDNQNARDKRNWVPCGTETVLPDAPR